MKILFSILLALPLVTNAQDNSWDDLAIEGKELYKKAQYEKSYILLDSALSQADSLDNDLRIEAQLLRGVSLNRWRIILNASEKSLPQNIVNPGLQAIDDFETAQALDIEGKHSKRIESLRQNVAYSALNEGLELLEDYYLTLDSSTAATAYEYFDRSIRILPDSYIPYDFRAQSLLAIGDSASAYKDLKTVISIYENAPSSDEEFRIPKAHFRKAIIERFYMNTPDLSLITLKTGLRTLDVEIKKVRNRNLPIQTAELYERSYRQTWNDIRRFQLDLYLTMPEYRMEAIRNFEQGVEEFPEDYDIRLAYAQLLEEIHPETAIENYTQASLIDSTRKTAYYRIGAIKVNKASALFLASEDHQRLDEEAEKRIVTLLTESLPWMEKAYSRDPADPKILDALIQITSNLQMVDQAARYKAELEALNPE